MYLYLKYGLGVFRICNIYLERCLDPNVGCYIQSDIDPTPWFKALVLDSVFVDCDPGERQVAWCSYSHEQYRESGKHQNTGPQIHEIDEKGLTADIIRAFFRDKEKLEHDELDPNFDELYDAAMDVCSHLIQFGNNNQNRAAFQNVVRLLHIYVFPRIELCRAQKINLENALVVIDKETNDLEKLIQIKIMSKQNILDTLAMQRREYIKNGMFYGHKKLSKVDPQFLKLFLLHVSQDVEKKREEIQLFEIQITPLRKSVDCEHKQTLKTLRQNRNLAHAHLEDLLRVREEVTNFLNRRHTSVRVAYQAQYTNYIKLAERVNNFEASINDFKQRKVKVARVQEAVIKTLAGIDNDGPAFDDLHSEESSSTPGDKPQEWATVSEKVNEILQNPRIPHGTKYRIFCAKTKQDCVALMAKLADDTFPNKESACEDMCKRIMNNLQDLSKAISQDLIKQKSDIRPPTRLFEKVFASYERLVSKDLLDDISEVFESCYRKRCRNLFHVFSIQSDENVVPTKSKFPAEVLQNTVSYCTDCVNRVKCVTSIADKLREVKKIAKYVEKTITEQEQIDPCSDDFVETVIEICSLMEETTFLQLFSQIKILEILCPDFWLGTSHNYAVVTISAAQHFLLERMGINV